MRKPASAPTVAIFALLGALPALAAPPAEQPVRSEQEAIAVDLRTVPFYAIDKSGQPVFDLRSEEVELRIDGRPVAIDTFDRHRLDGGSGAVTTGASPPPPTREVFLVVDQAFLTPAGLLATRDMGSEVVSSFLPSDLLFLIVNDPERGFRIELGPVRGDADGQSQVRARLEKLRPKVDRLRVAGEDALPPYVLGKPNDKGIPLEQVHNAYEAGGALERAEYRSAAEQLAQSLRLFALQLARSNNPKLVVFFSGGLDTTLYFEGEVGYASVASGGDALAAHVDTRRAGPILQRFEGAFAALAASGANTFLVNPDATRQPGREMLQQMRGAVGGLLLEQSAAATLARELRATTAAFYVAGFYAREGTPMAANAKVEVAVRRPGVRALAARGIRTPRLWRSLDATERRLAVLDLVRRAAYPPGAQGELVARQLQAQVLGASTDETKRLELVGQWPAELAGHRVEVYEVLLRAPGEGQGIDLLAFRESSLEAPGDPLDLQVNVVPGAQVWAVVLVEPTSGATYLRRLLLTPERASS